MMQQIQLQCQSCGMPLLSEELYGTDSNGSVVDEFCKYCYENGAFTQPSFTVDDMIAFCVPFLVEEGMGEQVARDLLAGSLPGLKRWSSTADAPVTFRIVQLDELKLAGITARTTNKQEGSKEAKIGGLWGRFWSEGIGQAIAISAGASGSSNIYGCYIDYENDASGEYTILIGCSVEDEAVIPEGMTVKQLPASRYAVFTTNKGPVQKVVLEAWQTIWKWAETTEHERAFTGDFELYDERSGDPEHAQVDIYIAI
jgi:predicted transcriptional regulator YdeE